MERLKGFGIGKIVAICFLVFILCLLPSLCSQMYVDERFSLGDIGVRHTGPASRIIVTCSPDKDYPYSVMDAGFAAYRFNAVKRHGPPSGGTTTFPAGFTVTVFLHGNWVNITGNTGMCVVETSEYKAAYEFYSQDEGYIIRLASDQEAVIGRGLVIYARHLEEVDRVLIRMVNEHPLLPAMWTESSEYVVIGDVRFFDHQMTSDPTYPLVFKMLGDRGCVYVCGRGTVKTQNGEVYRLGYEDTVGTCLPRLGSNDKLAREGAAQSLGWLTRTKEEKEKAVPALIRTLKDKAMEVRRDAAEALGRIGDSAAKQSLKEILSKDSDDWVREVAEESIQLIEVKEATIKLSDGDKKAIAELMKDMGSKWTLVRKIAAESFSNGGVYAMEEVANILERKSMVLPLPGNWKAIGTGKADSDYVNIHFDFCISNNRLSLTTNGPIEITKNPGNIPNVIIGFLPPDSFTGSATMEISEGKFSYHAPNSNDLLEGVFNSESTAIGTWRYYFFEGPLGGKGVQGTGIWTASYVGSSGSLLPASK